MAESDPWLELARRARAALPNPPAPAWAADVFRRSHVPSVLIPSWWLRLVLLTAAVLVIAWCDFSLDQQVPTPFALDHLEFTWFP